LRSIDRKQRLIGHCESAVYSLASPSAAGISSEAPSSRQNLLSSQPCQKKPALPLSAKKKAENWQRARSSRRFFGASGFRRLTL
jgi:hypothetical protein